MSGFKQLQVETKGMTFQSYIKLLHLLTVFH